MILAIPHPKLWHLMDLPGLAHILNFAQAEISW
jgi:hypothetical protein